MVYSLPVLAGIAVLAVRHVIVAIGGQHRGGQRFAFHGATDATDAAGRTATGRRRLNRCAGSHASARVIREHGVQLLLVYLLVAQIGEGVRLAGDAVGAVDGRAGARRGRRG